MTKLGSSGDRQERECEVSGLQACERSGSAASHPSSPPSVPSWTAEEEVMMDDEDSAMRSDCCCCGRGYDGVCPGESGMVALFSTLNWSTRASAPAGYPFNNTQYPILTQAPTSSTSHVPGPNSAAKTPLTSTAEDARVDRVPVAKTLQRTVNFGPFVCRGDTGDWRQNA